MKYVVSLLMTVFAWSANGQYLAKQAFPNLPNFAQPLAIENAKDGSNRFFVVEQKGKIYVFQNSPAVSTRKLFLDLADVVSQSGGEMGLLGLAFHPNYKTNGYFYVNYTTTKGYPRLTSVTSRFSVSSTNKDSAVRSSEQILFTLQQPYDNHNGGCVKFGPDGYLYITFGDGGSGGDPQNRAQNLDSLFGKILRIDVNNPSDGKNYGIPQSNPFASSPNANRRMVYAYGLRNVWRMSFDAKGGKLWAGDVGQGTWEEIDIIESGKNYGWKKTEGKHCYSPSTGCDTSGITMPVIEYQHTQGNFSVTGGFVYRGSQTPGLYGKYIYSDYTSGRIWMADSEFPSTTNQLLIDTVKPSRTISSFGVDENDELYYCAYGQGRIYHIESTSPPTLAAPTLIAPKNDSVEAPIAMTLSWDPVNTATSYEVMTAFDPGFTQFVRDTTVSGTSVTMLFASGTMHFWKVRAKNATLTSEWSEMRTFTVRLLSQVPPAPKLIYPIDGKIITDPSHLRWTASPGASEYRVELAYDMNFSSRILSDTTYAINDTTLLLPSAPTLPPDTLIYWRVQACTNDGECSPWSEVEDFTYVLNTSVDRSPNIEQQISIYPNPTTGSFTISSESEHIKNIRIYDVKGEAVSFVFNGQECSLTKPVSGTYFVEVELQGGAKVAKKIVVE